MTDKHPTADEQPADLAAFAADTLLLDALGSGEPAPPGDGVASLLASWRADLEADLSTGDDDPEVARLIAAAATDRDAGTDSDAGTDRDAGTDGATVIAAPRAPGRSHRAARRVLGVAAAVLAAGGGLIIGAGHATPGSPLWPVTRVVYREQADNAQIEQTLAQARRAATEGRVADARRLLARADALIAQVSDPDRAKRLRAELNAVRDLLPAATPGRSAPPASGSTGGPAPATGAPTTGLTPVPTTAVPQPQSTAGGGRLLPPIGAVTSPGLPLPTLAPSLGPLPLPLPTGLLPKAP